PGRGRALRHAACRSPDRHGDRRALPRLGRAERYGRKAMILKFATAIMLTAALALGVWNTLDLKSAQDLASQRLDDNRALSQENSDLSYLNYQLRSIAVDAKDPN